MRFTFDWAHRLDWATRHARGAHSPCLRPFAVLASYDGPAPGVLGGGIRLPGLEALPRLFLLKQARAWAVRQDTGVSQ